MKSNKTRAALLIYDYTESFDKLTALLQIEPSSVHEANPEKDEARRWVLESVAPETDSVEEHVGQLVKKLEPSAPQLRELAKKYWCRLSVGLDYYEFNPEITLSPKLLQSLGSLGVELWFDIYNMWDENGPEGKREYHLHK
jgi:hypothetical protein